MAVESAMFVFEVVVNKIESFVDSDHLMIRSDFGDVFSLELKDPKLLNIVVPEQPPEPPEPPGKKKKKKAKPKKAKKKKGKKGAVEPPPPPEPVVLVGQSVLFTSTAEFLIQTMKKFPLEMSLWSHEEYLTNIGSISIPWDPRYLQYLEDLLKCKIPLPVNIIEEYNVRDENNAKIMAKVGLQVKLSCLKDRITTSFRCLSDDLTIKKYLYTGLNSKLTSYMCTLKTSEDVYIQNDPKLKANFVTAQPKDTKIQYADYKNAPAAEYDLEASEICCLRNADKPPDMKYKVPETMPDIDFIIDYVRKIIRSCNDNMRMLTPRLAIKPKVKATDLDRLCYCRETRWPEGNLAERFKAAALSDPCPICLNSVKKPGISKNLFDASRIRGPCGRPDCKVARRLREYIEELICEDHREISLYDIIGPCGNKSCNVARKIQEFLLRDGPFNESKTLHGLSTQCACVEEMKKAIEAPQVCMPSCDKKCEENVNDSDEDCGAPSCPFKFKQNTFIVNYFTVEYDFNRESSGSSSGKPSKQGSENASVTSSKMSIGIESVPSGPLDKYKYCGDNCISKKQYDILHPCSKSRCSYNIVQPTDRTPCDDPICETVVLVASPADSNVVINIDKLRNPCGNLSCEVADKVKTFLKERIENQKSGPISENPCVCDCDCSFKFTKKTTYCPVCGGYECLGDDMLLLPCYSQPHPCPIYHKTYDKNAFQVISPWPDENDIPKEEPPKKKIKETLSLTNRQKTSSKVSRSGMITSKMRVHSEKSAQKTQAQESANKSAMQQILPVEEKPAEVKSKKKTIEKYPPYPKVPKNMGWNWVAEDIPGMKPRPKWKPGATLSTLVRKYKSVREGGDSMLSKKKRANLLNQKKKKIEDKPTVVIKKHKGDYTVQMEVIKKFSKERLRFQYPYDDVPPVMYTIGKTQEEIDKLKKLKDRRDRREKRRKCKVIQSTFRDKCQEICLKSYNQAIGVLPPFDPNNPECPCDSTEKNVIVTPPTDSCSCSDEDIESSDSDGDSWTIEFTPPVAKWEPQAKHPAQKANGESQYHYSDYRVKLVDKYGKEIPRFFTGLDGTELCSDLGGFWGPDKVWLEINKDGYIGPDGRWVPYTFMGPDGSMESSKDGAFTDKNGDTWRIGIDGYVDKNNTWAWYGDKTRSLSPKPPEGNISPKGKKKTERKSNNNDTENDDIKKKKNRHKKTSKHKAVKSKQCGLKANAQIAMMAQVNNKGWDSVPGSPKTFNRKNLKPQSYDEYIYMPLATCNRKKFIPSCKKLTGISRYCEVMNDFDFQNNECQPLPQYNVNKASNNVNSKSSTPLMKLY